MNQSGKDEDSVGSVCSTMASTVAGNSSSTAMDVDEKVPQALPNLHQFNAIGNIETKPSDESWLVRAPLPVRGKVGNGQQTAVKHSINKKPLSGSSNVSAFAPSIYGTYKDSFNLSKRCCSAPLPESIDVPMLESPSSSEVKRIGNGDTVEDKFKDIAASPLASSTKPQAVSTRMRCLSASISSPRSSPAAGMPRTKNRLNQLIKEESIEGIQNKEKEHEREVQFNFQISSNWNELTLKEGGGGGTDRSENKQQQVQPLPIVLSQVNKCRLSPLAGLNTTTTTRYSTGMTSPVVDMTSSSSSSSSHHHRFNPRRQIDFGFGSTSSSTSSSSVAAPSPPTTPTCGISNNNNVPTQMCVRSATGCMLNTHSRSPSPSPTRKTFITRRRSQSPCVVKPSVLATGLKRKYDSDNECVSPKRQTFNRTTATTATTVNNNGSSSSNGGSNLIRSPVFDNKYHRTRHLSKPSSLVQTAMSVDNNTSSNGNSHQPPLHPPPPLRPTHISLNHSLLSNASSGERCSSPASSTCSSSSLEGLKDLPPFVHHYHLATAAAAAASAQAASAANHSGGGKVNIKDSNVVE